MELDQRTCDRARRSRDPRFDGRFFIGVTSTRVYCRTICPARAPKDEHVRYFPSAAAAEAAGFRPCLRCRPEASPGTPAWLGNVTSRALDWSRGVPAVGPDHFARLEAVDMFTRLMHHARAGRR